MLSGLILDGGPSWRLDGERKALLPFGDETIIQRQIRELRKVCAEVIVVTPDPIPFLRVLDPEVRIITDYFSGKGAFGGMHAGLSLARYPHVWVVGNHMPFPSADAAMMLLERKKDQFEAIVPRLNGRLFPLHGVYDKRCAKSVQTMIENGVTDLSALMNELRSLEVSRTSFLEQGIRTDFAFEIYTWDDYRRAFLYVQDSYIIDSYHGEARFW